MKRGTFFVLGSAFLFIAACSSQKHLLSTTLKWEENFNQSVKPTNGQAGILISAPVFVPSAPPVCRKNINA